MTARPALAAEARDSRGRFSLGSRTDHANGNFPISGGAMAPVKAAPFGNRTTTRVQTWQSQASRVPGLPVEYTGSTEYERPLGSFERLTFDDRKPDEMPQEEHEERTKRVIAIVHANRAGAIENAVDRRLIPKSTDRAAIHRAYNHASMLAVHDFGIRHYDFKMDDHLKGEMRPLIPFIRYARRRVKDAILSTAKGEWRPYRKEFGKPFKDNRRDKLTGEVRLRLVPNDVLVKFAPRVHAGVGPGVLEAMPPTHRHLLMESTHDATVMKMRAPHEVERILPLAHRIMAGFDPLAHEKRRAAQRVMRSAAIADTSRPLSHALHKAYDESKHKRDHGRFAEVLHGGEAALAGGAAATGAALSSSRAHAALKALPDNVRYGIGRKGLRNRTARDFRVRGAMSDAEKESPWDSHPREQAHEAAKLTRRIFSAPEAYAGMFPDPKIYETAVADAASPNAKFKLDNLAGQAIKNVRELHITELTAKLRAASSIPLPRKVRNIIGGVAGAAAAAGILLNKGYEEQKHKRDHAGRFAGGIAAGVGGAAVVGSVGSAIGAGSDIRQFVRGKPLASKTPNVAQAASSWRQGIPPITNAMFMGHGDKEGMRTFGAAGTSAMDEVLGDTDHLAETRAGIGEGKGAHPKHLWRGIHGVRAKPFAKAKVGDHVTMGTHTSWTRDSTIGTYFRGVDYRKLDPFAMMFPSATQKKPGPNARTGTKTYGHIEQNIDPAAPKVRIALRGVHGLHHMSDIEHATGMVGPQGEVMLGRGTKIRIDRIKHAKDGTKVILATAVGQDAKAAYRRGLLRRFANPHFQFGRGKTGVGPALLAGAGAMIAHRMMTSPASGK